MFTFKFDDFIHDTWEYREKMSETWQNHKMSSKLEADFTRDV